MVRLTRLELVPIAGHAPQTCVYADSTTTAYLIFPDPMGDKSNKLYLTLNMIYQYIIEFREGKQIYIQALGKTKNIKEKI